MQFTLEEINKEIEKVQQDAGNLQSKLQQLIGYRQALIDIEQSGTDEEGETSSVLTES